MLSRAEVSSLCYPTTKRGQTAAKVANYLASQKFKATERHQCKHLAKTAQPLAINAPQTPIPKT